ncbi:hypothetical protein GN244_ATG09295 [Phytophthora infestans]|uniref:Secreted RxLR effector peptide protein n=1 Tax=Phytophthora infestans TaxID=4787 RepID=A0A833STS9_PHYIN|nr:hypothetical protein GN244_ATG09295 [Phytophthora infestans]
MQLLFALSVMVAVATAGTQDFAAVDTGSSWDQSGFWSFNSDSVPATPDPLTPAPVAVAQRRQDVRPVRRDLLLRHHRVLRPRRVLQATEHIQLHLLSQIRPGSLTQRSTSTPVISARS